MGEILGIASSSPHIYVIHYLEKKNNNFSKDEWYNDILMWILNSLKVKVCQVQNV